VVLGISGLGMIIASMLLIIWVKRAAKGKVYAFFFEPNREVSTELVNVGVEGNPERLKAKDDAEYSIVPDRTFWFFWPPGFPQFVKQPIPALIYNRNKPDPISPDSQVSVVTAQSMRFMLDENMLRQTYKDARDAVADSKTFSKTNWQLWILGVVVLLLIGIGYMSFVSFQTILNIKQSLGLP